MPLLDHFHPPLSARRPWESFRTTWATSLADTLNRDLPPGYIALEDVHSGAPIEIDAVQTPPAPSVVLPASFPERCAIEVVSSEGGRTLVAAIELVSPRNKDRESKRRLFASKCVTHFCYGVGLVIVDVVANRQGNLHNEVIGLLGLGESHQMPTDPPLYAVAYRPLRDSTGERIDTWPMPLAVGQPMPCVPLSLGADLCLPVNLEETYQDACRRRKVEGV